MLLQVSSLMLLSHCGNDSSDNSLYSSMRVMDPSIVQRGVTSFRWFLAAHADELSGDLLWALGEGQEIEKCDSLELAQRIRDLNRSHISQLCTAIEEIHRTYFGTMNGRELSSFLHRLAEENTHAHYG